MSGTERRERYEAAVKSVLPMTSGMACSVIADAVMEIADAELASANGQIEARRIELLWVNERHAADRTATRAAALREAVAELKRDALGVIPRLLRMADEAQHPTTPDEQDPHA
ncbi:hypothetical protein [Streptomyces sp. NRRL S-920]|uniref:hypothetical protein n=1 Tax=Streptomyces sp. NRRL S-920 TaxID=1463921 RepID=UPI0004C8B710|nr:hypothetical protein [Streptomyces sp. NRRL S-920]